MIELTYHRNRRRVGRPDSEMRAACRQMRSQLFITPVVSALREEMEIVFSQNGLRGSNQSLAPFWSSGEPAGCDPAGSPEPIRQSRADPSKGTARHLTGPPPRT